MRLLMIVITTIIASTALARSEDPGRDLTIKFIKSKAFRCELAGASAKTGFASFCSDEMILVDMRTDKIVGNATLGNEEGTVIDVAVLDRRFHRDGTISIDQLSEKICVQSTIEVCIHPGGHVETNRTANITDDEFKTVTKKTHALISEFYKSINGNL